MPPFAAVNRAPLTLARYVVFIVVSSAVGGPAIAVSVPVTFAINPTLSTLDLAATMNGFSDNDSQSLSGTIAAAVDLGAAGTFPLAAGLSIDGANATINSDYAFSLFLSNVSISEAAATLSGPSGGVPLSLVVDSSYDYDFAADMVALVLDQGTIVSTGFTAGIVDFADQNAAGVAIGETGRLALSVTSSSGPYLTIGAVLTLPIGVDSTIDMGGVELLLSGQGVLIGETTFVTTLSTIAADFNDDLAVTAADLAIWSAGFGTANASHSHGDATANGFVDGADFLIWQRQYGLAPPAALPAVAIVSEPTSLSLLTAVVACPLLAMTKRRPDFAS